MVQGARHLLAYSGSRALLQAAYSVQQFDAETIGLKYSRGDRRRLLDAPGPAYGAYETVTLPGAMCTPPQISICLVLFCCLVLVAHHTRRLKAAESVDDGQQCPCFHNAT